MPTVVLGLPPEAVRQRLRRARMELADSSPSLDSVQPS
jgi:DNA-directed RNA polymerase specialized sigma24 family protein